MPKWRVWAEKTTRSYIDIEANTQDEAWEKAGEANEWKYKRDYSVGGILCQNSLMA